MSTVRSKISPMVSKMVTLAMATFLLVAPATLAGAGHARAADGVSTQTVALVANVDSGQQLVVMRMVFEPGIVLVAQRQSGPVSLVVISGTLQTTLVRGGAAVDRYGTDQVVELGATMNLNAGVVISYSPGAVRTVANRGNEPLVLMATMLVDPNEPMVASEDSPTILQIDTQ